MFAKTFTGRTVLEPDHFPDAPWMALPVSVRKRIARRVLPSKEELIEHRSWDKYSNTKFVPESRITGKVDRAKWEEVVLRIHWSRGTNDEIASDFRKWLTKYRRKVARIPPPHRTRAAVNKAWLKRLAEMRLWKAGGSLEGALELTQAHVEREKREAVRSGKTRPKDPQLTEPISSKADEDSVREDISRVVKDLRLLFGWVVKRNELPISYPFRRQRR